MSLMIRAARPDDFGWLKPIFSETANLFWSSPDYVWRQYWEKRVESGLDGRRMMERWDVVPGKGYVHWNTRTRGSSAGQKVIYEIGVSSLLRKQGIGKVLVEHVGRPLLLKTDYDNDAANAFYERMGFQFVGTTRTKKGKAMNNWFWG